MLNNNTWTNNHYKEKQKAYKETEIDQKEKKTLSQWQ